MFRCPDCGKPNKLSYNPQKDVFHPCWSCTWTVKAGRLFKRIGMTVLPSPIPAEDKELTGDLLPGRRNDIGFPSPASYFLDSRGVQWVWARTKGWFMGETGKWAGRLVIPITENGKLMCWVARSIDGREPKELSGPNRSHFFYGYDSIPSKGMPIFLVEGIFDCIHLTSFNLLSLALMGSHISEIQIGKLLKLRPSRVIIMLDGDDAGRKGTDSISDRLGKRMDPMRIHRVWLPDGKDPDDLTKEELEVLLK